MPGPGYGSRINALWEAILANFEEGCGRDAALFNTLIHNLLLILEAND
jgi:hypothetical protein